MASYQRVKRKMQKRLYVATYGCQMNERDSEEVLGMLTAQGYEIAEQPEQADVILLNTCSVRQHAEERAFGKMGELSELKKDRPEVVLGIIGCMAKLQQEAIFKRLPKVDLGKIGTVLFFLGRGTRGRCNVTS